MADVARAVDAGSGINVLVNPGSTGDMQIVKLAYSGDGVETKVTADASGLLVKPSNQSASSASLTNVNDTASSTSLLASNSARKGAIVYNDSTTILYLKYGTTASTTSFTVKIPPDSYWEMPNPIYTGAIDGIWSADASGAARITEL